MEKEMRQPRAVELLQDDKIVIDFLRGMHPYNIATRLNATRLHVLNVLKKDEEAAEILPSLEEIERVYKEMNGIKDAPTPVEKAVQPKKGKMEKEKAKPSKSKSKKAATKKKKILSLVKKGVPAKEISELLKISISTVYYNSRGVAKNQDKNDVGNTQARMLQVEKLDTEGKTTAEISALLGITQNYVYKCRALAKKQKMTANKESKVAEQSSKPETKTEQIIRLSAEGKSIREICELLQVPTSTVYNARSDARKYGAVIESTTLSETKTQQILRLGAEGKRVNEICDLLQVTKSMVYNARGDAKKRGVDISLINRAETKQQQIIRLSAEGKTINEICSLMGVSKQHVYTVRSVEKNAREKEATPVAASIPAVEAPKQQTVAEPIVAKAEKVVPIAKAKVTAISSKESETLKETILKTTTLPKEATQLNAHDEEILTHIFALYDNQLITRQEVVSLINRS
jgi:DNA-binding CsgD family transcriptional regulator